MKILFPYEEKRSNIFKVVKRPIVLVDIWSKKLNKFLTYSFIVDTGADYTLLPKTIAKDLGIDILKDCYMYESKGIGGKEQVYFLKKKIVIKIGESKRQIPIGFLDRDDIPPLLGRQQCLDTFDLIFSKFTTTFSS